MKNNQSQSEIILYTTIDGAVKIDTVFRDETIWLTQKKMAELFDCSSDNISLHLKNTCNEPELLANSTSEYFSVVRQEGNRTVSRKVKYYILDAIIAVGYRVNSKWETQF